MPPNAISSPSNVLATCPEAEQLLSGENAATTSKQTGVLFEGDADTADCALDVDVKKLKKAEKRKLKLVWRNIMLFGYLHLAAVYGGFLLLTQAKWATVVFCKQQRISFRLDFDLTQFFFDAFLQHFSYILRA